MRSVHGRHTNRVARSPLCFGSFCKLKRGVIISTNYLEGGGGLPTVQELSEIIREVLRWQLRWVL